MDKSKYPYNVTVSQGNSQGGQGGPRETSRSSSGSSAFVQRLDKNGDGKISRSEFDGPADRFDFHDNNKDGYLSQDEAPKGPPPGGRRR